MSTTGGAPPPAVGHPAAPDADVRAEALDPSRSFLVQAPAGSGKTDLLTQRFLHLLCTVEEPEQVLAITFTRKAAAEMRDRILGTLAKSGEGAALRPELAAVAGRVLARDAARGWRLADTPSRLRVMTIDALCALLARAHPLAGPLAAPGPPLEDPTPCYEEAARAVLTGDGIAPAAAAARACLLTHLDNDLPRLEALLVRMLARRDQWQRGLPGSGSREALEAALDHALRRVLGRVRASLLPHEDELLAVAQYAAGNLDPAHPLGPWRALTGLPAAEPAALPCWRALPGLLLTRTGGWRRTVRVGEGFPPKNARNPAAAEWKSRWAGLRDALEACPGLAAGLHELASLPEPVYQDSQWQALQALLELLRQAAARLHVVFAQQGRSDFTAVALAALDALGEAEAPSELLLGLDARIRHILVDEFQDTSELQYALLRGLSSGWQPGDGRTVFLVGDPMQSIYRFRSALVGIFLETRRAGRLGELSLTPLRLRANFRSRHTLVDWVNRAMADIFPPEDAGSGAVAFEPALSAAAPDGRPAVHVQALEAPPEEDAAPAAASAVRVVQARQVAGLIGRLLQVEHGSIAVLVRARSHVEEITHALGEAGIPWRGVELSALAGRPAVQDLLALTRALGHAADRAAWLAVLRAPWCGLGLHGLHALGAGSEAPPPAGAPEQAATGEPRGADPARATLWSLLCTPERLQRLPPAERPRAERLVRALAPVLARVRRQPAREVVESAWVALGGPACLPDAQAWQDCQAYLQLLGELAGPVGWPEASRLERALADRYVTPPARDQARVQVMTVHKSKGLEFDTVLVPGLERGLPAAEQPLLLSVPHPNPLGLSDHLLAPLPGPGSQAPLFDWLRALDRAQAEHEQARLLYVAATRARRALYWLVGLRRDADGQPVPPPARSLLSRLWQVLAPDLAPATPPAPTGHPAGALSEPGPPPVTGPRVPRDAVLRRVPADWYPPALPPAPRLPAVPAALTATPAAAGPLVFDWAGATARHVGTLVHRLLARIAIEGLAHWDVARVRALAPRLRTHLGAMGVPGQEREAALTRCLQALCTTLESRRGRWCLAGHAEARSEWPLSGLVDGVCRQVVVDRSFVDRRGRRWVVDFKTGVHEGGDLAAFLDRECERYADQMARYSQLIRALDSRPLRAGLYFPLVDGWRAWTP